MIRRFIALTLTALVFATIYYLSRFWTFSLWPRSGLAGFEELRPTGGLLARWLRGTDFAPFELLIWAIAVFLILTWLQKLFDLFPKKDP
ncbi:MAG: hypothetical protein AB8B51_18370 [Sedimentitalea sp.]